MKTTIILSAIAAGALLHSCQPSAGPATDSVTGTKNDSNTVVCPPGSSKLDVGYMHRDLVENRKWITEDDYREGLALSQLAPGPLAAQLGIYIGFVHHRLLGATLAGLAFVLPSFLMVLALGAIYVHYQGISWMQAVFYGVGAAVIGIIAGAVIVLGKRSIQDVPTALICIAVIALLMLVKKVQEPLIILIAALLGLLIKVYT
jgi:chromate transporter